MIVYYAILFHLSIPYRYINGLYAEGKSPKTIESYSGNLKRFAEFCEVNKLIEVAPVHIRFYLADRARTTSSHTTHQAFRVLRTFFRWCIKEGFLDESPLINIKAPKVSNKVIPTFSNEEIKKMLSFCKQQTFLGERNHAMVLCLLDTGMRASELIGLKLADVDFQAGIMRVRGKGDKERLIRLGNISRQALWKYMLIRDIKAPENEDALWLSEEMKPFTKNGLFLVIRRLGKRARIEGVRCSPHTFRHTFAVDFLRNGGNVFDLQTLLGHSSLEMVKRYSQSLNTEDALRAHAKFSPVDRMLD